MNQIPTLHQLKTVYHQAAQRLLAEKTPGGYWVGELSASALSTATAISTLSFFLEDETSQQGEFSVSAIEQQIESGVRWLIAEQKDDGGWGDTTKSHSNISTSMLVIAALTACGKADQFQDRISRANKYVESRGGVAGIRQRYGIDKTFAVPILANAAMVGLVPWREVSALPFEAACVPQRFYHLLQLPVVSYAIPALVAIGQVKFHFDPPWDPIRRTIRKRCIHPSLRVLEKMMPASGGFLEAVPLTSFVSMALIKSGKANHPVVQNGLRFIIESFRQESSSKGSWPIDTNLATWTTTLSVNALATNRIEWQRLLENENDQTTWRDCLDWILACQNKTIHPFTGAAPGGWGWTDLSGAVPDADDTPGALLALKHFDQHLDRLYDEDALIVKRKQIHQAVNNGVRWLLGLQNRDKGWPTFCRGWGKLPFDRSGTDITAHVIRGLLAWKDIPELESLPALTRAIDKGFSYLRTNQQKDGSWLPLWFGNQDTENEINPCYGTAKVLMAYADANAFDTNEAKIGLEWIRANQNVEGGWGGGPSLTWQDESLGNSSVEETALCVEALLLHDHASSRVSAAKGIQWLSRVVENGRIDRSWPIGFYFAKLWYFEKLYPLIFATSALGRAVAKTER